MNFLHTHTYFIGCKNNYKQINFSWMISKFMMYLPDTSMLSMFFEMIKISINLYYFFFSGGGWALCLQIRVWARGSDILGISRQSAAKSEGRIRTLRQRGRHGAAVSPWWGGVLSSRTSCHQHGSSVLLQRLHVLMPPTFSHVPYPSLLPAAPIAHAHPIHLYIRQVFFFFWLN